MIEERTFAFSLRIIETYRYLLERKEFVLSKQLLRAGTSIGANVAEAQAAISRKEFTAKMSIAAKEARESVYWLRLLDRSGYLTDFSRSSELLAEAQSINLIICKIVKTAQKSPATRGAKSS